MREKRTGRNRIELNRIERNRIERGRQDRELLDRTGKRRIVERYLIFLGAGVILLLLWWQFYLKEQTVQERWVLESGTAQEFTASADRAVIRGIGLCNDDAVKSVYDLYNPCVLTGTLRILDSDGRTVWERQVEERKVPTLKLERMPDLVGEEIELSVGETYRVEIAAASGEPADSITWVLYGGSCGWGGFLLVISGLLLLLFSVVYSYSYGLLRLPFPVLWIGGALLLAVIGMLVMVPPCVADEELHFGSAYAISNQWMAWMERAGLLPEAMHLSSKVPSGVLRMSGFDSADYLRQFWTDWTYGNQPVDGAGGYALEGIMPHYSYAVSALGITAMRLLRAPFQLYIIAAREMNVLLYAVLTWIAMRVYPPLRRAVIAISVLPSVLWIVNSCSYDVWNLGFCILFACLCARLGEQRRVSVREGLLALLVFVAFAPIKFIYANFLLLLLFIQRGSLVMRHKRVFAGVLLGIVLLCGAVVLGARGQEVLTFLGNSGFDARAGVDMQTTYTIGWVLTHPLRTALVYIKTLYTDGFALLWKLFLGDQFSDGIPLLLGTGLVCTFLAVLCGTAAECSFSGRRYRVAAGGVVITGVLIVMSSFLFVYSYRGGAGIGTIRGMQGRYFLPLLICLPFLLPGKARVPGEKGGPELRRAPGCGRHGGRLLLLLFTLSLCSFLTRFCSVITG